MPYLSDSQILELTNGQLRGKSIFLKRGKSTFHYELQEPKNRGKKGLVWLAKDDDGDDVAFKFIPAKEYLDHSIVAEINEAKKLNSAIFADIKGYGTVELSESNIKFKEDYVGIATRWCKGEDIYTFLKKNPISVDQFITISIQLFRGLAALKDHKLSHDDLHPGNILIEEERDPLDNENYLKIQIIDTGTIKRESTRKELYSVLEDRIETLKNLKKTSSNKKELAALEEFRNWKKPDDHFRIVETLFLMANSLSQNYHKIHFWERNFFDQLTTFFTVVTESDRVARLDDPKKVTDYLQTIRRKSKVQDRKKSSQLSSPFEYISAEMIRNDREFADLFSKECPWLNACTGRKPLYIYGPRGCGKSTLLRWLAFKTVLADKTRKDYGEMKEIGVYISCSVELRSRFWLVPSKSIKKLQAPIIRYFSLLLLEELFDTLSLMYDMENEDSFDFGLGSGGGFDFSKYVISRISQEPEDQPLRLQGQDYFSYLRDYVRRLRWETWSKIRQKRTDSTLADPSIVSEVSNELQRYFPYFGDKYIVYLVDDYSNQRIPNSLQTILNSTITFAKLGTPIFKVSSEYFGVNMQGIDESREVFEINIGESYTSIRNKKDYKFLADIINRRLSAAKYKTKNIESLLGVFPKSITKAIKEEKENSVAFNYHGINCIHWLCSGDVALALDIVRKIFEKCSVDKFTTTHVSAGDQHKIITQFSYDEIKRVEYIFPHGERLQEIVILFSSFSRAVAQKRHTERADKKGDPYCMTHIDIRLPAIKKLRKEKSSLWSIFQLLRERSILFTLQTSRSRIEGNLERLQLRKIYIPVFKGPLKRDTPIKIDNLSDLKLFLSNPRSFFETQCKKVSITYKNVEDVIHASEIKFFN